MRLLSVFLTALLTLSALAQQPQVDPKTVDRVMTTMLRAWQIPGAAVAIVQNDRVVYVQGYGTKELGKNDPVTPDTLFQIASTSKAFTTTALAMLMTEKKLAWDDPVRNHLEYFRLSDTCADSQVTIRDIVSHRTGLRRHDELWDNSPLTREEVVRRIGFVGLTKAFRTAYQYQNIMFIAAGEIVTNRSGMTWDDFVRTRIFKPLGMTRSAISDAEWSASTDRAIGYSYDGKTGRVYPQRLIDTTTIGAGGAIKSSARDMANWVRFHLANGAVDHRPLVDAQILEETKTPQTVVRMENLTRDANPESHVMSYAMGWVVQDYRGELLVSHAGALNGFRTHVDLMPERNSGFVIMINAGRGLALIAVRNALADMLSAKPARDWNAYYLMIDGKAEAKEAKDREERLAKRVPNTNASLALESYGGEYESRAYGALKITPTNGTLVLQWSRMTIPLTHFHYDTFTARSEYDDVDEEVVFALSPTREVEAVTFFGERFARK